MVISVSAAGQDDADPFAHADFRWANESPGCAHEGGMTGSSHEGGLVGGISLDFFFLRDE